MTAPTPLATLFTALADELAHWGETAEDLQHLFGDLQGGARPTALETRRLQALDHLVQHIHQISAFCGAVAAKASADADLPSVVRAAADELVLGDLAARLSADDPTPRDRSSASGELELW